MSTEAIIAVAILAAGGIVTILALALARISASCDDREGTR